MSRLDARWPLGASLCAVTPRPRVLWRTRLYAAAIGGSDVRSMVATLDHDDRRRVVAVLARAAVPVLVGGAE